MAAGSEKPTCMDAPKLSDKKVLEPKDFSKLEPLPDFSALYKDTRDAQRRAVEWDQDPFIMPRLFYSATMDRGYDMSTMDRGDRLFLAPNSTALTEYTQNQSQRSTWTTYADFTTRYTKQSKLTSIEAMANIASPFCSFATKAGIDNQTMHLAVKSTYSVSSKFLAPIGRTKMAPHHQIRVDDDDDGEIVLSEQFLKAAKKALEHVTDDTTIEELKASLKEHVFVRFGDVYAADFTFGVASYHRRSIEIEDERQLESIETFRRAGGQGSFVTPNGIPVAGGGSASQDTAEQTEEQMRSKFQNETWEYIGLAIGDAKGDPFGVLAHRLDSKQWDILQVHTWVSVTELFPKDLRQQLKLVTSKYPDFMWHTGVDFSARYSLHNLGRTVFISRWCVDRFRRTFTRCYHAGVPEPLQISDEKQSQLELVMSINPGERAFNANLDADPCATAMNQKLEAEGLFVVNEKDFAWTFEAPPGWPVQILAIKNFESNKYLSVDKVDNIYIPCLKAVSKHELSNNEKFGIEFIKQNGGVQIVWIGHEDGERRALRMNSNKPKHEGFNLIPIQANKEVQRVFLYTRWVEISDLESWGDMDGYHLEFHSHQHSSEANATFVFRDALQATDCNEHCVIS
eukprot:TRINITY_DN13029_c0_g1_i1.p1 TRINITY_DN13029_c0_g1~~TRINITY_DN13029_c0_g1_i1.p1  ORF type:complete len:626 (-),score=86.92 TRINITY_DN13029_c0_g1_i1:69-1946(-)